MISNCNCPEKIDCGCELEFDSYETGTTSVLDVGSLVNVGAEICEIEGYVIDWYRNGELALVSASEVGLTSEATAFHPFTGASAIPVIEGTYIPIVRFIVVNGEKIFTSPRQCQKFCDMTINLPEIEINCINCDTISGNPPSGYNFRITYNSSQDWALAGRKVKICLPEDGSAIYFAVYFKAFLVADKVSVYYNDSTTSMESWVVGTNNNSWYDSALPYRYNAQEIKFAFSLPEYTSGDYLIIEVVPSVLDSNYQTNWELSLKCLTSSTVFEYDYFDDSAKAYDIDTLSLIWDSTNCLFKLSMQFANIYPWAFYNTNLGKYCGASGTSYNSATYDAVNDIGTISLGYKIQPNSSGQYFGTGVKLQTDGNVVFAKNGSTFTITCTNATDYNGFKDKLVIMYGSTWYTDWVGKSWETDGTDIRHYGYFMMYWITAAVTCGDNETLWVGYFGVGSTVTYDDINYIITIEAVPETNDFTSGTCDSSGQLVTTVVNSINVAYNLGDFSHTTRCRYTNPFYYYSRYTGAYSLPPVSTDGGWIPGLFYTDKTTPEWMEATFVQITSYPQQGFVNFFIKLVITASRNLDGSWIDDPLQNFEAYSYLNPLTDEFSWPTKYLIYKIEDGVVLTKRYHGT